MKYIKFSACLPILLIISANLFSQNITTADLRGKWKENSQGDYIIFSENTIMESGNDSSSIGVKWKYIIDTSEYPNILCARMEGKDSSFMMMEKIKIINKNEIQLSLYKMKYLDPVSNRWIEGDVSEHLGTKSNLKRISNYLMYDR